MMNHTYIEQARLTNDTELFKNSLTSNVFLPWADNRLIVRHIS